MTLDSKSDRAPTPGRSQQQTPDELSLASDSGDGLSFRLKTAVWTWRLRVPHGPAGHRYFAALERQLAAHTARNLEAMRRDGWPPDQAEAAAREWLHDLADTAIRLALATAEAPR
jgi:hypothetical protein